MSHYRFFTAGKPSISIKKLLIGLVTNEHVPMAIREQLAEVSLREHRLTQSEQDIRFFGKIEDQFGQDVERVKVRYSVKRWRENPDSGALTSGADGRFAITNGRGEQLDLSLEREGYRMATTNSRAYFSLLSPSRKYAGSETNPTILRMWRLGPPQNLKRWEKEEYRPIGNAEFGFNLATGNMAEAGADLKIAVRRGKGSRSGGAMFDWGYTIEAPNGGILIEDEMAMAVTFAAPTTGYARKVERQFFASDPGNWQMTETPTFWVTSGNGGIYAKVHLIIRIETEEGRQGKIALRALVNMEGSQRLEADF